MKNLNDKQKVTILIIFILVACIGFLLGIFTGLSRKNREEKDNLNAQMSVNDNEKQNTEIISKSKNIIETIPNVTIKGMVELNREGSIYITDSYRFGEFGYQLNDEYTEVNIESKNQTYIDYFTSEEYSVNDIGIKDRLICTGDLIKTSNAIYEFDTKENAIIVLKAKDYTKMLDTAKENKKLKITVGQEYLSSSYIFLRYDVEDNTRGTTYNFPSVVKTYMTNDTQILGNLEKGKKVEIEFDNKDYGYDRDAADLKMIKVID